MRIVAAVLGLLWILAGFQAVAQGRAVEARQVRDAALSASEEIDQIVAGLRSSEGGAPSRVGSAVEERAREVQDELARLSQEDRSDPGWAENSYRRLGKILAGLERIRVDLDRSGGVIQFDLEGLKASMGEVAQAVEAEKARSR